jgi:hypothetical protein
LSLDYDGYDLHRLRIVPTGSSQPGDSKVTALRFIVPLKPEYATHLHAVAGDWFRSSVSSIALGQKDGVLWHSGQSHGSRLEPGDKEFGQMMTVGNFKPYVWIGSANRGLAFMADNDQGWVPDDTEKTPALEVIRKAGQVCLVLNLVALPFAFDRPREIAFSLQATPIKPIPDDFRARRQKLNMGSAFTSPVEGKSGWSKCGGEFRFEKGIGIERRLFGMHAFMPYRVNWDVAKWFQQQADKGNWVNTPYQSQLAMASYAEIDDPRMPPGKQVSDVRGYIAPHTAHGTLEHGSSISQPDLEYRLYNYDNWIKQVGLKGMYFDQTEPLLSANPKAGFGYVIDLHDRPDLNGKVQPGYGVTRARQFYRRLRALFAKYGVDAPYLWLHTTGASMVSAFAFADTFLEGENTPKLSEEHPWISEKIPPARMQAIHNSPGKWGINMTQLPMLDITVSSRTHPTHNLIKRCWHGWFMLHDVEPHSHGMQWAGLDLNRRAVFLPYWDRQVAAALSTGHDQVFASAYRQDNKLIVIVFNCIGDDLPGVALSITPAVPGLEVNTGRPFRVVGSEKEETGLDAKTKDGTVTVPLPVKARGYRMIVVGQ